MRSRMFTSLCAVIVAAVWLSCSSGPTPLNKSDSNASRKSPPVPAATIDELASGKSVFETNCILCHRSNGTGGRVSIEGKTLNVGNLTAAKVEGFSDERIIGYVMNGIEDAGMPAFKGKLSEGELRDVVKYIRLLQGKK